MAKDLTDASYELEVASAKGVVLVDFWAEWCTPCKILAPIIEDIAKDYENEKDVKIMKLNTDENPNVSMMYGVMSIPTTIIFKDGAPVGSIVGVQPKDRIVAAIENAREK